MNRFAAVNRVGSAYAARRGRRSGEFGSITLAQIHPRRHWFFLRANTTG